MLKTVLAIHSYGKVLCVISYWILLVMKTKHSIRLLVCSKTLVYIQLSHDRNIAVAKPISSVGDYFSILAILILLTISKILS